MKHLIHPLAAIALAAFAGHATGQSAPSEDAGFNAFLGSFEQGIGRFINGDAKAWKDNASQRGDVTIMGAWGAYERDWDEASRRYDWAARRFAESGAKVEVEYLSAGVSGDLAYTVAIERSTVRLAGMPAAKPMALRVTHLFRKEDGQWKMIHRHADPLMAKSAPTATLQN